MYTVDVRTSQSIYGPPLPWTIEQRNAWDRGATHPWAGVLFICGKCGTRDCTCGSLAEPTFDPISDSDREAEQRGSFAAYAPATLEQWGIKSTDYRPLVDWMQLFYATVACDIYTEFKHHEMAQEKVKFIADYLAKVVTLSCLGEARYVVLCTVHELHVRGKEPATLRRLMDSRVGKWALSQLLLSANGSQPYISTNYEKQKWAEMVEAGEDWTDEDMPHIVQLDSGGSRDLAVLSEPPMGLSPLEQARLARSVFVMHTRFCGHQSADSLSDSFAGPLWAHGADLAVRYYSGKLTPMMFVDQIFDAVHNSSSILSKVVSSAGANLEGWYLNWRQAATLDTLVMGSPTTVRRLFGIDDDDPQVPHLPLALVQQAHSRAKDETDGAEIEVQTRLLAEWWHNTEWQTVGETPAIHAGYHPSVISPHDSRLKPTQVMYMKGEVPNTWLVTYAALPPGSKYRAQGEVHFWTEMPTFLSRLEYDQFINAGNYIRKNQERLRESLRTKYRYVWRPVSMAAQDEASRDRLVSLFGDNLVSDVGHTCVLCHGRDKHVLNRMRACADQVTWPSSLRLDGRDCHAWSSDCFCKLLGYGCHEAATGECEGGDACECEGSENCYRGYSDCYCREESCCHSYYYGDGCDNSCECDACCGYYCRQNEPRCYCSENSCCHEQEQNGECSDECDCAVCDDLRAEQDAEAEAEAAELEAEEAEKEVIVV